MVMSASGRRGQGLAAGQCRSWTWQLSPRFEENTVTTTRFLKALIDTHLSAAKIFEVALREIEQGNLLAQEEGRTAEPAPEPTKRIVPAIGDTLASYPDGLLTIAETTAILKIGRSTLYSLVKDNKLAIVKIGRASRIRRSDIRLLVDQLEPISNIEQT